MNHDRWRNKSWTTPCCDKVLNRVLGIQQYLDSMRACTLFLLLRRLSSEETMSTRLTHDLWCNWTGLTSFLADCFNTLGPALNGNFGYTSVLFLNDKYREVKRMIAT